MPKPFHWRSTVCVSGKKQTNMDIVNTRLQHLQHNNTITITKASFDKEKLDEYSRGNIMKSVIGVYQYFSCRYSHCTNMEENQMLERRAGWCPAATDTAKPEAGSILASFRQVNCTTLIPYLVASNTQIYQKHCRTYLWKT